MSRESTISVTHSVSIYVHEQRYRIETGIERYRMYQCISAKDSVCVTTRLSSVHICGQKIQVFLNYMVSLYLQNAGHSQAKFIYISGI